MLEKNEFEERVALKILGVVVGVGIVTFIGLGVWKLNTKSKEGQMQPETVQETTQETSILDNINGNIQYGEEKICEPGEHYICVRMPQNSNGYDTNNIPGAAISNIPEGYEVYTILSYTYKVGYGSATGGYDIWFVNTEKVKVTATYSDQYGKVGYYTFGTVVEQEKQLTK